MSSFDPWINEGGGGGGGGSPTGPAGGSLTGTYPNPGLATSSVGSAQLQTNSVGSSQLQSNAVTAGKVANSTIGAAQLQVNAAGSNLATSNTTIDVNGQALTNLATPGSPSDAVTKAYADALPGSTALTALTNDVSATGPSSFSVVNAVGGSSAANIHASELATSAATAASTPSTIIKRDINSNIAVNAATQGVRTTVTSASALPLTDADAVNQRFEGTTAGMIMVLPDATTLPIGRAFNCINRSTQDVAIENASSTFIKTCVAATDVNLICIDNSTLDGVWSLSPDYVDGLTGDLSGVGPGIMNASINFGAVTTSKIADSAVNNDKLANECEKLVASVAINLSVGTKQTVYTSLANNFYVTKIVSRNASAPLVTAQGQMGWNAGASDVFVFIPLSSLTTSSKFTVRPSDGGAVFGLSGGVLGFVAGVTQVATITVDVFGYYI